jgi:hypothetical protein
MASEQDLKDLLRDSATVRVWDAQHSSVFVEGTVIAYSLTPMICVRAEDGTKHWHASTLPIERQRVEWDRL